MRYLILSDIHSNREALTTVLRFVRRKRFDRTVILETSSVTGRSQTPSSTWSAPSSDP